MAAAVALVGLASWIAAPWPSAAWGVFPLACVLLLTASWHATRLSLPSSSWPAMLAARGATLRVSLVLATGYASVVFAAVALGIVGQLLVAFPGCVPSVVLVAVALPLADRLGRARAVVPAVALAFAVIGARYEAQGPDARGQAWGGPIHGIHPFQTTAVMIDGLGPFDIAINDYVEPAGGRGYDPIALAAALELAFDRIAELHFADGPERARVAFAEATAEAFASAPVHERIDRDPAESEHWRLWVRSGTTGARSRVEFVCPGRRDEPAGAPPDNLTMRMCPDKYASEASAGLGVTGRWPGYAEQRGHERLGLSRLLGRTRSDDAVGAAWLRAERWLWVALLLLPIAAATLLRGGRAAASWVATAAWSVLPLALALLLGVLGRSPRLPAWVHAPDGARAWAWSNVVAIDAPTWLAALAWPALAGVLAWWEPGRPAGGGPRRRGRAWPWWLAALVLACAGTSDALAFAPRWHGGVAGIEPVVLVLADAIATRLGIDVLTAEAVVAAAVAVPLTTLATALIAGCGRAAAGSGGAAPSASRAPLVIVAVTALVAALAWSRKTDGGLALIPAALGVALVMGSGLVRVAARGVWPRRRVGTFAALAHASWISIGLGLVVSVLARADGDPARWIYGLVAIVAVLLAGVALLRGDPEPSEAAGPPAAASGGTPPPA